MDLKGISWVGNFYQKFEAMCLEVEEIMYQDTVKYVENQVQTVGSSVKRFYSDVMQDMLPPSSVDAAKGDSNLPLDFYGDVGIYMKPKMSLKEKNAKRDDIDMVTKDQIKTTNCDSDYATFHRGSHVDNLFPLSQEDFTGGASRQNSKACLSNKSNLRTRKGLKRENSSLNEQSGSVTRLNEDIKRISLICEPSNENHLCGSAPLGSRRNAEQRLSRKSSEKSIIDTPSGKDFTWLSPVCVHLNENYNSFHHEAKITTPRFAEETGTDFTKESQSGTEIVSEQIVDIPSDRSSSDLVKIDDNGMSEEMDMRASSGCASLMGANAANICANDGVISLVDSCSNWQVQRDGIARGEDFLFSSGSSNGWNTEVNEVEASFVSEMEVIHQVDNGKLEESCIVVNRDDFQFVTCDERKSKSYQRRIQDAFSTRKKSSGRKHEYEHLARWPVGDLKLKKEECARNGTPSLTIEDGKRSSTADICEAEWELL